jgi:hypothetical protein
LWSVSAKRATLPERTVGSLVTVGDQWRAT